VLRAHRRPVELQQSTALEDTIDNRLGQVVGSVQDLNLVALEHVEHPFPRCLLRQVCYLDRSCPSGQNVRIRMPPEFSEPAHRPESRLLDAARFNRKRKRSFARRMNFLTVSSGRLDTPRISASSLVGRPPNQATMNFSSAPQYTASRNNDASS